MHNCLSQLQLFFFILTATFWHISFGKEIKWCVKDDQELAKCQWLNANVDQKNYPSDGIDSITCVLGIDNYDCIQNIDQGDADVVTLDAGTAYYASVNFVALLLSYEIYAANDRNYYSVAVVPKGSEINSPVKLRGKRLCTTGVGDMAGWSLPLARLVSDNTLEVSECNNDVKTATSFFSSMCAPGALNSYHNPFGDNPITACQNCGSTGMDWCTYRDKYAGGDGPLHCLADGKADVAFMRSVDLQYITTPHFGMPAVYNPDSFELLCSQGGRKAIGSFELCNWGLAPADVIITSAERSLTDRRLYRGFFDRLSADFPPRMDTSSPVVVPTASVIANVTTTTQRTPATTRALSGEANMITLFNTNSTFGLNALVSTAATKLMPFAEDKEDVYTYVNGSKYQPMLDALQACAVSTVRLCVISEYEMAKCENMLLALRSKNLKPGLDCILDNSTRNCIKKIANDDADIMSLDAGDLYEAGKYNNLIPIANENYGDTGSYYYAVAVSRRTESRLTLFNLKARNSCHGSMRSASGWIYPILSLIETAQIKPDKCGALKTVGELFRRSCVPGILDPEYNKANTNPVNLCEHCASGGMDRCQRNTREMFYGDTGAFRCLTEYGGDIAFTRHMTPRDNTDGRNRDFWSRNRRSDDYELLCKNGRRAALSEWATCHLAQIPARAIVTAGHKTATERKIFWNLLNYAQQFFSSDSNPYFSMFDSVIGQNDLLFSDSTIRLVEVDPANQTYDKYLGIPFLKAVNTLNQFDCTSSSRNVVVNLCIFMLSLFVKFLF